MTRASKKSEILQSRRAYHTLLSGAIAIFVAGILWSSQDRWACLLDTHGSTDTRDRHTDPCRSSLAPPPKKAPTSHPLWPFDGREIPEQKSVVVKVLPRLLNAAVPEGRPGR